MQISEILSPHAVKTVSGVTSVKRLFNTIADMAEASHGLNADDVVSALIEREALGPTAVGQGVILPHARLSGLDRVRGLFLRLDRPMDCGAVDRQPVDLAFALLAPLDAGADHLKALALVSRTMRDNAVREKLRTNDDLSILHMILTEAKAPKAA